MPPATSKTVRETRRRSAVGLLLLACFLFGQAYVTMHHALVDHHVCAAGGELVHGDHGHGADAGHDLDADSDHCQDSDGPVLADDSDGEHGEQCSVPTLGGPRKGYSMPPSTPSLALRVVVRDEVAPQSLDIPDRVPVYRLAPKQSPPRSTRIG